MSSPRMKFLAVFLPVLLLLTVSEPGKAQSGTGAVSFGTVAIGQTSSALSVTLNFSAAGALATELALTKGADKQDFSLASGGSCAKGKSGGQLHGFGDLRASFRGPSHRSRGA
jgi:hypothetical protein